MTASPFAISAMGPAAATPFFTEAAMLGAEGIPMGMELAMGAAPFSLGAVPAAGAMMPWGDMAMAGAKGLLGSTGEQQPMPSGGGRPPGGGQQAMQIPAFDYGAPTVQPVSMADLIKQREEMLRRRRGY